MATNASVLRSCALRSTDSEERPRTLLWPECSPYKVTRSPICLNDCHGPACGKFPGATGCTGKGSAPQFGSAPVTRKIGACWGPVPRSESPLIAEWPYSTGKRHAIWLCLDCVKECLKVAQLSSRKIAIVVRFENKLPISCANLIPNRFPTGESPRIPQWLTTLLLSARLASGYARDYGSLGHGPGERQQR